MILLGSSKCKITTDENRENVPNLEINEIVLVHDNIVNNDYQHDLRVFLFLKTFNSTSLYVEVWFTDQNSKPLLIEHKINITLVFN